MPEQSTLAWVAFAMVSSLVLLVAMLIGGRKGRLDGRLRQLSGKPGPDDDPDSVKHLARTTLPKMGAVLVPGDEVQRTRLETRLIRAGLNGRQAMLVFLGVKLLLIVTPPVVGLVAGLVGLVPLLPGVLGGALAGVGGVLAPSFWLDYRKKARQTAFRRALPDALDVVVICLEGGLSLNAAIRRIAAELRSAQQRVGRELDIVQREIQLGRTTGNALRAFADRADMEELRGLASVVNQSERFGASLSKALKVHAESLRTKRLQHAEEMAQKAATKVLFPTILFIMTGVFVIIIGPAVIQILDVLERIVP